MANDDPILTTMRFIPKHETVQKYGAIFLDTLTNQAMKESDAYKTYYDLATGKAEQMKIVTKRSKIQLHSSHASRSGTNEGTGVSPGVLDVPTYESEDEHISWKSSDEDDDDETESDNDGDDFVHPKFSTHDEEVRQDEEDIDEECSDMRVQAPSHFESTDDETYDEVTQGDNVKEEKLDGECRIILTQVWNDSLGVLERERGG
ncbi:hypothetical protein Tco_0429838 [Tanacetum coccineum]